MKERIMSPEQDMSILDDLIKGSNMSDIIDDWQVGNTTNEILNDIKAKNNADFDAAPVYQMLALELCCRMLAVIKELSNHISELDDCVGALRILSDTSKSIVNNIGTILKQLPQAQASVKSRDDLLAAFRAGKGAEDEDDE